MNRPDRERLQIVSAPRSENPFPDPADLVRKGPSAWRSTAKGRSGADWPKDPFYQGLRLWARVEGCPEALRNQQQKLAPAHAFWLEHAPAYAFGLLRLMVETARKDCLDGNGHGLESIQQALARLQSKAMKELGHPRELGQLRALAVVYLADQLRALGKLDQAEECVQKAYRSLHDGTDAEIRVTVAQVEAELLRDRGAASQARIQLRGVEGLAIDHVPGRRAALLLALGRLHLVDHEADHALSVLREALRHCPEDRCLPLRLEIVHLLAAAAVGLRRYDEAQQHLEEAEGLRSYGHPRLHARQLWMLGHVALRTDHAAEAEGSFQQAFSIFQSLGQWDDAAKVLLRLTEVYITTRCFEEKAPELLKRYRSFFRAHELGPASRDELENLRALLAAKGVEAPRLECGIHPLGEDQVN